MNEMNRELVIQANEEGFDIALLENNDLVEFHKEVFSKQLQIGDIYWARVKKILAPLNAAFIDIKESKEAFLHFTDLGEQFPSVYDFFKKRIQNPNLKLENYTLLSPLQKDQLIGEILKNNDFFPVQILKEPIASKGARLTAQISFAGRFAVLIPFDQKISVSKKISNADERQRLVELCESITPKNFGLILRTVAEGKNLNEIHQDIIELIEQWNVLCKTIYKSTEVTKVFEEKEKTSTLLRDFLNDSFTKITVNDNILAESIRNYIEKIAPEKKKIVQEVSKDVLLFEKLGLNSRLKTSFNKTVLLPSGGYLIIENTEAMHVIDVNSGVNTFKKMKLEGDEAILKLNIEAAIEIARQIRLRDLGGIIVIDFVDSKNAEIKQKIYEAMLEALRYDRANHTILPLSKFCVMQITRSRVKPQVQIKNTEKCPSCDGTGKISSSIVISDHILSRLESNYIIETISKLEVHPYVYAYLKIGFINKWLLFLWKHKNYIQLTQNSDLSINEFFIYDKENNRL
jgi:ribonuclease G